MNDQRKWAALQRATWLDAQDPELRRFAAELVTVARRAADPERAFAQLAHAVARDWIPYETDTARVGGEDMAGVTRPREPALAVLRRRDDCDSKARLFVALCLAAGLRASLVPLWRGPALAHVSAEVWLNGKPTAVETILARARLGDRGESVPFEKTSNRWAYT